ncbi:M1 family metallopeptidase [Actinoplanes sp. CA-131856]
MRKIFTVSAATLVVVAGSGFTTKSAATPGAQHGHERIFPNLGNGGYDVTAYDLSFDYRSGVKTMAATDAVTARTTQNLSQFSLDSAQQSIGSVRVDGRPARFTLVPDREKLVVTPDRPLRRGRTFTVAVSYTADRSHNPSSPSVSLPAGTPNPVPAWIETPDGFAWFSQPDRAHVLFPGNDIPSDKARFAFHVTVPADREVVANGTRIGTRLAPGGRRTVTYRTDDQIPTDVAQLTVGKYTPTAQTGPHGLPIRSWLPPGSPAAATANARLTPGQIAWAEKKLGLRFPFHSYGAVGVPGGYLGVALETATLSTFSAEGLAQPQSEVAGLMAHELVHQWFGDNVSVATWDDMWLSEGHADLYGWTYEAEHGGPPLEQVMHDIYQQDQDIRSTFGPPGRLDNSLALLFQTNVPGALLLYGLRDELGEKTFQRIERTFYATYAGRSASTADFAAVASRVAGRDLTGYVNAWVYGPTTPAMPGHPGWQPGPVEGGQRR